MNSYLDRLSHFSGTPFEVGFQAGQKLGPRLEQIINLYITGVSGSKDLQKLRSGALPWFYGLPERFQDEFEGMAEGAQVPLQTLAEWAYIEECDAKQCSGAICQFDDQVWVARNNDFYMPELWGYVTVREIDGRIPTVNFCREGDIFAPTGINKEKLWLHYNFLPVWDEPALDKPHLPPYVFLTDALEICRTINDVETLLNGTDRNGGMLLFAVDGKNNEFALFECMCSQFDRRGSSNRWIVGTNHYCAREDITLGDADKAPLGTLSRFERMEYLIQQKCTSAVSPDLPDDLIRILADDEIERRGNDVVTVYSNVACPTTGRLWYTFGGYPAASQGDWQRIEWPWSDES